MGVPRQEQPVKIWGVAGQTSWTKGDFPRRREEQTALRPHSAEAQRKRYERKEVARKKHGRTAPSFSSWLLFE
ncbi:hypothetical protein NDU88_001933 [Pleurodeles waltl]|uniref:Uncharacterized protein n=1 Tax=Pleurodeles waltl TaxID=8319 RepID=A0AAV7SB27_PLEWA|nr:hypothetical protein NDU88_001933 [Pleurodeles waltl]